MGRDCSDAKGGNFGRGPGCVNMEYNDNANNSNKNYNNRGYDADCDTNNNNQNNGCNSNSTYKSTCRHPDGVRAIHDVEYPRSGPNPGQQKDVQITSSQTSIGRLFSSILGRVLDVLIGRVSDIFVMF